MGALILIGWILFVAATLVFGRSRCFSDVDVVDLGAIHGLGSLVVIGTRAFAFLAGVSVCTGVTVVTVHVLRDMLAFVVVPATIFGAGVWIVTISLAIGYAEAAGT